MRKHLLLFVLILLPMVASAVHGSCGANVTYTYIEGTNTLTISGSGDMSNYNGYYPSLPPWTNIRSKITKLIIDNGVTSIGNYAFLDCSSLTSVTIPNSVTSIGNYAFRDCSGLTSITIPNSVTSIGYGAFRYCSGLISITLPNSLTNIYNSAFEGCSSLTSVTIPTSITKINAAVFADCTSLTNITIPNSVTFIAPSAFYCCSKLESVTIPNSVKRIEEDAFRGCSSLTAVHISDLEAWCNIYFFNELSNPLYYAHHLYLNGEEIKELIIPNSVTSIGGYAFMKCSGLTSVTIPNSVTKIGGWTFEEADISTVISLMENPFAIEGKTRDYRTFSQNTFNNATLYVPKGTINKYKATNGWMDFVFIEEGIPAEINAIENTKDNKAVIYDLNGVRLSEPKKGINIINGRKYVKK